VISVDNPRTAALDYSILALLLSSNYDVDIWMLRLACLHLPVGPMPMTYQCFTFHGDTLCLTIFIFHPTLEQDDVGMTVGIMMQASWKMVVRELVEYLLRLFKEIRLMRRRDFIIESIDSKVLKRQTQDDTVTVFIQAQLKQSWDKWGLRIYHARGSSQVGFQYDDTSDTLYHVPTPDYGIKAFNGPINDRIKDIRFHVRLIFVGNCNSI
jgi:hypothetical protein